MDGSQVALADANLVDSFRAYARWQQGAHVEDRGGVMLFAGATHFSASFMNAAVRTDRNLPPAEAVQCAHEFFAPRNRGFTFVTRHHCDADLNAYLARIEFTQESDSPCLFVDVPLPDKALPTGARVVRVSSAAHIADIVAVGAEAYKAIGLHAKQVEAAFSRAQGVSDGQVEGVIAFVEDRPVSVAITVFSANSAGVYWVGTVPNARGKGFGELCTQRATNLGFSRGAKLVTLQASVQGNSVYRRMGFREYDRRYDFRRPE